MCTTLRVISRKLLDCSMYVTYDPDSDNVRVRDNILLMGYQVLLVTRAYVLV